MGYQFDRVAVHELAAQLYWRRAHRDGVANIDKIVMATAGEAVLEPAVVEEALFAMRPFWGLAGLPAEALRTFKQAAAAEAFHCVRLQRSLLGQVVFSDARSGRAPSVAHFVPPGAFDQVRDVPAGIHANRTIPSLGRLVVRSPLPAIVISETPSGKDTPIIRVADTSALGADLAMYLHVQACDRFEDGQHLVTGTFVIPARDAVQGQAWSRLIPNSTRFYREFKTHGMPDGDLSIAASW